MASDLSSGCTETIDILDEKEEGEISLEDVSSSEEGGIGHLTCGYVVRTRRSCPVCKSTWGECASWCTAPSKMHYSKSQSRRDPVKGKENRHHVNEAGCTIMKHVLSTLQEKNDDLVPISSDSDMEIVGLTDMSKQLMTRSKTKIKKKKKKKKEYEYLTVDDLISPASADLPITECFSTLRSSSRETSKEITISRTRYRDPSPVHRSGRTRMIAKSPLRKHRSPVGARPTFHGSSRSPLERSRSPRRSPRRLRSPKRSSSLHSVSPMRVTSRKQTMRLNASPPPSSSAAYFSDRHGDVTRLLKKVKHLDSVGARWTPESSVRRNKEHQPASLKEKLCNMMKIPKIANDHMAHGFAEKTPIMVGNELDEEDDLALLRQKALDTKQKNKPSKSKQPTKTEAKAAMTTKINDEQDEEALELRMIALRSAVMKKHQNRVQRGVRAKNKRKAEVNRSESPFTQSFLEDIPVPNEELLQFASPPSTPPMLPSADSNHVEDMELDTDVEREKEKLPYSPTDKITTDMPIDTELLGIEPSDVSFINLNNSPIFATNDERRPSHPDGIASSALDDTYLPYYTPSPNRFASSPLLSNSDESFHVEPNGQKELPGYLRIPPGDCIDCDLIDGTCCQQTFDDANNKCSYPIASAYPETNGATQNLPVIDLPASSVLPDRLHVSPQMQSIVEQSTDDDLLVNLASTTTYTEQQTVGEQRGTPTLLNSDSVSIITGHDSHEPENQQAFPAASVDRDVLASDSDYVANDAVMCCQADTSREPSYMQGVPDITKDANKIPTLINKTLVPVPILKSNKQLQQPLPSSSSSSSSLSAKQEQHTEPTFKSAEMQPVIVITSPSSPRSGTVFKPIRLVPFPKKRYRVLTAPVVFKESMNESSESNVSKSDASKSSDGPKAAEQTKPMAVTKSGSSPTSKKRKRAKKNSRANCNVAESTAKRKNGSCTNNDVNKNVNITTTVPPPVPRQPSTESEPKKKNNDANKARGNFTKSVEESAESKCPTLPADNDKDIRTENTDNVEKNDQHASSHDKEELKKHTTSSTDNECPQEKSTESHCSSANLDTAKHKVADAKDANRRASMDEDENELRAILLASLTKRMTKSDTNSTVSSATSVVTNECNATNDQAAAQKVSASTEPVITANGMASDLSVGGVKKRPNAAATGTKGPPKKMLRKAPVPASTKVVNNAKKYQNTMVQRKLNPQKLEANVLNKGKVKQLMPTAHQDNVWSVPNGPTKKSSMAYASETQRIVINLGSDSDSESELEKDSNAKPMPVVTSIVNVNTQEPNTDFEKSLHKFLRDVRKEHETSTATSSSKPALSPQTARRDTPTPVTQTDTEKDSSNMHTPLAVRHLSASKQEEYRRLKQQILEREKLKEQRKVVNKSNDSSVGNKVTKNVSNASARQNQTESKEPEKDSQQPAAEIKAKIVDVAKSTTALTTSPASVTKGISNIAKQTNSMQLQAKTTKKIIPNLSIRITNEIAPARVTMETKTLENSVEFVNKHQPMSDKLQFRPALRTLSRDEINRKYVQVQLNQDTTERVVTINDKTPSSWHDTTNTSHSDEPVENSNAVMENLDERTANKSNDDDRVNDSNFSNATTVLISNTSEQELMDSMETTISRSQYEREMNRNISASSLLAADNCCNDGNDVSSKSSASTGDAANTEDAWSTLKRDVKIELESLARISKTEQQRHLSDIENKLVARRYTVLDHLADMSGNLRQWDMEKELQNSLAVEVKKLKEQLIIAEERLEKQRNRVSNMGPKITMAHQKINTGRRECFKLSRICTALGNRLGKNYKLPEAGGQLLNEKLKEIANHTRQLSNRKLLSNDASENFILPSSSLSESSKITLEAIEDVLLQTLPAIDMVSDVMSSQDDDASSLLARCNNTESSPTIDTPQTLPNEVTPTKKKTSMIVSKSQSDEQESPTEDRLLSEPKLSSTPISVKRNNECTQRTRRVDIPVSATSLEPGPSVDYSLCPDNEREKKRTQSPGQSPAQSPVQSPAQSPAQSPMTTTTTTTMTTQTAMTTPTKTTSSTMMNTTTTAMTTTTTTTTTMMTTTMTTTTTTTIKPYVSILTHLKTPRNVNPNGILCPYDLMGICNDGDCQFIHQSASST
ncbi:serine-rich adhesin for platelets-like isoform X2 [Odontomachus brunneus]|uniref:serine-rich adhesin for platelets-like isoform X2 n=1 Tax=Odontomachus brunneus TaxID=486640 RepID=UPI0013F27302|nr:serine-rich adhesin for platelets-like isoform X2 [Odontomachus brunneus]